MQGVRSVERTLSAWLVDCRSAPKASRNEIPKRAFRPADRQSSSSCCAQNGLYPFPMGSTRTYTLTRACLEGDAPTYGPGEGDEACVVDVRSSLLGLMHSLIVHKEASLCGKGSIRPLHLGPSIFRFPRTRGACFTGC